MRLMRIGVDLAKNVFQIHGVDRHEQPVWRQRLPRDRWLQTVLEKIEPGCEIGMESCGGAHHWAQRLQARGFRVRLIAPQFVKPYAASEPAAVRLQQLRGVGPMIVTALVAAIGDASQFANGRQLAASLGLTPKQHSSGGKDRLLGISKRGGAYLRTLMIHGARSALRTAKSKDPIPRLRSNPSNGKPVEPASAKPSNVQVRKARRSDWEPTREQPIMALHQTMP